MFSIRRGIVRAVKAFGQKFMTRFSPLRRWWIHREFAVELALIEGTHVSDSVHQSILHFSVNRAASQYVKDILSSCAEENDLVPVRFHAYSFMSDFPYLDRLDQSEAARYTYLFKPHGYLYTDLGGMIDGIDWSEYLILLAIRDPRDVLTSQFFSTAFSHEPPWEPHKLAEFQAQRDKALRLGIDRYVLDESARVGNIYRRYLQGLVGRVHVHVATYEQMVNDFSTWLNGILCHTRLKVSLDLRNRLIARAQGLPPSEDPTKHQRQVMPGDFRRKLQSETISELNGRLRDILIGFGYKS